MKAEKKKNFVVLLTDVEDQQIADDVIRSLDGSIYHKIEKLPNTIDVIVIDVHHIHKNEPLLVKLKKESSAYITAILLVCRNEEIDSLETIKDLIDDVILSPVDPEIMKIRLQSLSDKVNYSELYLKKKKEMIDEFESEWKDMVEQSPDLVQISFDGKIEYINPAGARIYGAKAPSDMIGQFVRHPQDEMTLEELQDRIKVAQNGGTIPPRVLGIMNQSGERRFVKAFSTFFKYNGKNAVHTVGQDITELMRTQKKLKRTILQKQALLQEIHHRVKNNLAIINGLIELQFDNVINKESELVLKATQARIMSISKVHELLYQQDHFDEIDTKTYLTNLVDMINNSFSAQDKCIEFKLNIDSFNLSLDQAIPCGLLLNELISNSLKHGFELEDDKKVELTVRTKDKEIFFHYRDFGRGLEEDFDVDEESNFGMLIIRTLLDQLQAEWKQKSDEGFHLIFTFQKNEYNGPIKKVFD